MNQMQSLRVERLLEQLIEETRATRLYIGEQRMDREVSKLADGAIAAININHIEPHRPVPQDDPRPRWPNDAPTRSEFDALVAELARAKGEFHGDIQTVHSVLGCCVSTEAHKEMDVELKRLRELALTRLGKLELAVSADRVQRGELSDRVRVAHDIASGLTRSLDENMINAFKRICELEAATGPLPEAMKAMAECAKRSDGMHSNLSVLKVGQLLDRMNIVERAVVRLGENLDSRAATNSQEPTNVDFFDFSPHLNNIFQQLNELHGIDAQIDALNSAVNRHIAQGDKTASIVESLVGRITKLEGQMVSVSEYHNTADHHLNTKINQAAADIGAALASLQLQVDRQAKALAAQREGWGRLEARVGGHGDLIKTLQERARLDQNCVDNVAVGLGKLKTRVDNLDDWAQSQFPQEVPADHGYPGTVPDELEAGLAAAAHVSREIGGDKFWEECAAAYAKIGAEGEAMLMLSEGVPEGAQEGGAQRGANDGFRAPPSSPKTVAWLSWYGGRATGITKDREVAAGWVSNVTDSDIRCEALREATPQELLDPGTWWTFDHSRLVTDEGAV